MTSDWQDEMEWPPFDVDRLSADERELWDTSYASPPETAPVLHVWGLAEVCEFDYSGVPEVVREFLTETGFLDGLKQYVTNMRKATGRPRM